MLRADAGPSSEISIARPGAAFLAGPLVCREALALRAARQGNRSPLPLQILVECQRKRALKSAKSATQGQNPASLQFCELQWRCASWGFLVASRRLKVTKALGFSTPCDSCEGLRTNGTDALFEEKPRGKVNAEGARQLRLKAA
jgi:hypothetical protein